jgi:2-phospho-L-lactate guanylyltransferase
MARASSDTWAIIPVKAFSEAKRRLAGITDEPERRELARGFLDHTLAAVLGVLPPERVIIVSRDAEALDLATAAGAVALRERGRGLNPALRQAAACALGAGAGAVLVVASDLPLLKPADLVAMTGATAVAIAPNRDRGGTNALFLRPPALIDFAFGRNSFARHVALAAAAGVTPVIVDREGLSFDLDLPADLAELRAIESRAVPASPAFSPAPG